jgi:hypothetical protein
MLTDYPTHELNINFNKRAVEMDLKSPAGKAKFRELLMDADVVVNNLLAGTMDKLGFGFKDVLEIIKGRGKGIVYAESVSMRQQSLPFLLLTHRFFSNRTHLASMVL